jgi:hypothetical protein
MAYRKGPSDFLSAAKDQAVIVESETTSFVKGITPEQRQDIINSALLAQLVEACVKPHYRKLSLSQEHWLQRRRLFG